MAIFAPVRAHRFPPVVYKVSVLSVEHLCFAVRTERSRDNSLRFLSKFHPDIVMEHIDHDYLSTQVIQIPSNCKTNATRGAN